MESSPSAHLSVKQTPNSMRKTLWIVVLAILVVAGSNAQSVRTITGKVTSAEDGSELPGVNVVIKGTNTGTITNGKGDYSIALPRGTGTLVFSFIGLKTVEFAPAANNNVLNVQMAIDVQQLSEVVVVGYGVQKESRVVGYATSPKGARKKDKSAGYAQPSIAAQEIEDEPQPDWNTEEYDAIRETGFRDATRLPLSTFSIDVDAASYSNIRRFITNGQRPPVDAVRIEEMVNYFDYDYQQSANEDPFSVYTEVGAAPWNNKHKLVHIGLQGKVIPTENLPASNLVFLIDVSGSMADVSKLPLLKASFQMLVAQLRDQDRVAIVVYAGAAGLVLPSTKGSDKQRILESLEKLEAGGSTAGGAGIKLAYAIAKENFVDGGNNRVILATDGDFNVGESSNAGMERLIEEKRQDGVFLTVLGFGMGNYKDSKMEVLADKGNGNYAYIDNILEAQKVLVNEFGGTLFTIAKDVKIQVEFNPVQVKAYRLIGYENRRLNDEDFNNDKKDAGEIGSGHAVTALYEIIPVGVDSEFFSVDGLKYQKTTIEKTSSTSNELMTVKIRYKKPDGITSKLITKTVAGGEGTMSENFKWSAAVAGFGMLLKNSEYIGKFTYDDVLSLAESSRGADKNGYRIEMINMVKSLGTLASR